MPRPRRRANKLRISPVVQFVVLLLGASVAACGSNASNNPIIGKYHLTGETTIPDHPGPLCTMTELEFTATTQTVVANGATGTTQVAYNTKYTAKIYVIGNTGI